MERERTQNTERDGPQASIEWRGVDLHEQIDVKFMARKYLPFNWSVQRQALSLIFVNFDTVIMIIPVRCFTCGKVGTSQFNTNFRNTRSQALCRLSEINGSYIVDFYRQITAKGIVNLLWW